VASATAVGVVAAGNPGKRREIAEILADVEIEVGSLADYSTVRFPDEGHDYRENAIEKARAVADQIGQIAVADDSGIEVAALDGAPGPLSARFGGPGLDDRGRLEKLLAELADVDVSKRAARFVCYAALATPDGDRVVSYGECKGEILTAPVGKGGFGYDPIFRPEGFALSMAQIEIAIKNRISHRALAMRELYARWVSTRRVD